MKRIVTDVNGRTPVFKTIATMADMKIDVKAMSAKTQEFVSAIASYREDIMAASGDFKVSDLLSERSIMEGTVNPKLIDALTLVGATVDNLKAFRDLGFSTHTPELAELNGIQAVAYSSLRDGIKEIYEKAVKEFTEEAVECPHLDAFKLGIAMAGEPFLSFPKFLMAKGKSFENLSDDEIDNLHSANQEAFLEWRTLAIEEALCNLMDSPKHSTFLAPVGIEEVFNGIKAISLELYNTITNFGENVDNINFSRTTEFIEAVKSMDPEARNAVINIINVFNERNRAGKLNISGGQELTVPASIAIPDVIIGLLLHAGEVILSYDEIVKGGIEELLESVESEEIKTLINIITTKCEKYDNPTNIALNLIAMPAKFIPTGLYQNPMFRVSGMPELTALNANIGELLLKEHLETEGE